MDSDIKVYRRFLGGHSTPSLRDPTLYSFLCSKFTKQNPFLNPNQCECTLGDFRLSNVPLIYKLLDYSGFLGHGFDFFEIDKFGNFLRIRPGQ